MAYDAPVRVWYGPESYQYMLHLKPTGFVPGGDPLPVIVYRPGGGWAGADISDLYERIWWRFCLGDSTSLLNSSYHVFVLQTASVGYNRHQLSPAAAWSATFGNYAIGNRVRHGGRRWYCWVDHASGAGFEPGVSGDVWRDVGVEGLPAWVGDTGSGGEAYILGSVVGVGARPFACIQPHTSSAAGAGAGLNEPGEGGDWALYWREIGRNETGLQQVPDLGEVTPGGLDEQVMNAQQAIAFLRRNAEVYGLNPDWICIAGASAGGQMAGCAAYAEDLAWARENQIHGATRGVPRTKSQPNAALLSITPVDLVRHTTYDLKSGLYGEDGSDADWVARPAVEKQSMSPLYVLKRTGLSIPTCLDYIGGANTGHTSNFAGLVGSPYHHPDNGWLMLRWLTLARPDGLGETNRHIFFDNESHVIGPGGFGTPSVPLATVFRSYTVYGTGQTNVGNAGTPQLAAEAMITWLNDALEVV